MYAPLAGAGLGIGARLIKHLIDQQQSKVRPLRTSETQIPVEITPEEALEFERQGQDVKLAANWDWLTGGPTTSPTGGIIRGALGTSAAVGGYALIDHLIERARKKQLRGDIDQLRGRLSNILEDQPAQEDIPLHAQMKAAEDAYFTTKTALLSELGAMAGGAAVLSALASFRRIRDENPAAQRMSELRALVRPEEGPSRLQLTPVVNKAKLLALLQSRRHEPVVATPGPDSEQPLPSQPKVNWGDRLDKLRKRRGEDARGVPLIKDQAQPAGGPTAMAEQSLAF